jgi:hypothetical protein
VAISFFRKVKRLRCASCAGTFTPPTVPLADFMQLTKIPIIVYYGDNIPEQPSTNPGQEQWRVFRATARAWRDAVNRRGGDVTLVELPSIGIRGNTHFPMSDVNNIEIADHLSEFLRQKGARRANAVARRSRRCFAQRLMRRAHSSMRHSPSYRTLSERLHSRDACRHERPLKE